MAGKTSTKASSKSVGKPVSQGRTSSAPRKKGKSLSLGLQLTDLLLLGLCKFFVALAWILPKSFLKALFSLLLSLASVCIPKFKTTALTNLEIAFPEKDETEIQTLFRAHLSALANHLALLFSCRARGKGSFELPEEVNLDWSQIENEEILKSRVKGEPSEGLIIIGTHLGPFEIVTNFVSTTLGPLSVVARDFEQPRLNKWWNAFRERRGAEIISRAGSVKVAERHLNEGRAVILLADQNIKRNHAEFADFFGIPAATTKSVALLALRTGAPVVLGTMVQTGRDQLRIKAVPLTHPRELGIETSEQVSKFCTYMNAELESAIREFPEQWFWLHRRFKTRPPGEPENIYSREK